MCRIKHMLMLLYRRTCGGVKPPRAHATTAGGIVIPQHDKVGKVPHELTTFIWVGTIPDNIPQANITVDLGLLICAQYRLQRLKICMHIRKNSNAHHRTLFNLLE
jgi:hypothetical protein